jgi:GNAT superfamily N-acetyltransferase
MPITSPSAPSPHWICRTATPHNHDLLVVLLTELVTELGPESITLAVIPKLSADIRRVENSPYCRFFLFFDKEEAIALARADILQTDPIFRLRDDQRCGYVDQMYVRPAYRGQGLGTRLLHECEAWFRSVKIDHCVLHAAPKAVRFYAREGYQSNREMFKAL